jgi:hypothetical protein
MKYFYRWEEEEEIDVGRSYSSGRGPLIKGERMQTALVRKAKGTSARPANTGAIFDDLVALQIKRFPCTINLVVFRT